MATKKASEFGVLRVLGFTPCYFAQSVLGVLKIGAILWPVEAIYADAYHDLLGRCPPTLQAPSPKLNGTACSPLANKHISMLTSIFRWGNTEP